MIFNFGPEDVQWLLLTIKNLWELPHRPPTHRNIWSGSYDVWSCEQDRIDAVEIPKARMKAAEDDGLIFSETRQKGKYKEIVWHLTDKGKQLLETTINQPKKD
jgi:hypothetical protein